MVVGLLYFDRFGLVCLFVLVDRCCCVLVCLFCLSLLWTLLVMLYGFSIFGFTSLVMLFKILFESFLWVCLLICLCLGCCFAMGRLFFGVVC